MSFAEMQKKESFPHINSMIKTLTQRRVKLLTLAQTKGTEKYVYDAELAKKNISLLKKAFLKSRPEIFYAIKSNPHSALLKTVTDTGVHLDASSRRELSLAMKANPKKMIFTGPGKDEATFRAIIQASRKTKMTVHLESLHEARLLSSLALQAKTKIRTGVRIRTTFQSSWAKFGISIEELRNFFTTCKKLKGIEISGIQFHISWMGEPTPVQKTLKTLSLYLKKHFSKDELHALEFIDIGGGIVPEGNAEGLYPWNKGQVVDFGKIHKIIPKILKDEFKPRYLSTKTVPHSVWGKSIEESFKNFISPICPKAALWMEPGRAISHDVMHVLLKVKDVKAPNIIIVDGGNNMVGWEKHEFFDYTPVYNLTNYSPHKEFPCLIYGSLCTPHDIWGFYLRGGQPKIGDVLCMPFQGAYTNTLMQDFIRGMPEIIDL